MAKRHRAGGWQAGLRDRTGGEAAFGRYFRISADQRWRFSVKQAGQGRDLSAKPGNCGLPRLFFFLLYIKEQ
ncbi:hypothetical protein [Nitrobacter sp.]|uniref:hypothetical protein n=1 Tax=Nitrobacter sp. TaxID=29420 RepID=UPI003F651923